MKGFFMLINKKAPDFTSQAIVNGTISVLDGEHTGARPGSVLRHGRLAA